LFKFGKLLYNITVHCGQREQSVGLDAREGKVSRGQVVYPATPDSTAVVKGSSTSDVLLLLKTELMMVTEVEDEG
jgi:hypothetical protein